jgi:hypothetical protein
MGRARSPCRGRSVELAKSRFNPAAALYSVKVAAKNAAGTGAAIATASPVSPITSVAANTVVLTAATMSALGSDTPAPSGTGSVLVWPAPAPSQVSALTAGQVIVAGPASAAPNGLLGKVAGISTDGSGDVTVTTTPAALGDVFTSLAIASTSNPLAPSPSGGALPRAARFIPATSGIRELAPQRSAVGFKQTLTLSFDYSDGDQTADLKVAGQLSLTPALSIALNVDSGFAGVPDGISVAASASVAMSSTVTVVAKIHYTKLLGEIDGAPIDVQVGPVPLVIVPKVPITLGVNGQLGLQLQASVTIGGSMSWDSRNPGKVTTANTSVPLKVKAGPLPGQTNNGQLVADLSVQPQLDIYDVGGPNLEGDALLTAVVNLNPPPSGAYLTVTPSLNLLIGLDVNLFGIQKSFEIPLLTVTFPEFKITKPPGPMLIITPDSPQVQPGHTIQFRSARTDGAKGHPVTWTLRRPAPTRRRSARPSRSSRPEVVPGRSRRSPVASCPAGSGTSLIPTPAWYLRP